MNTSWEADWRVVGNKQVKLVAVMADGFGGGIWYVDLAPMIDPEGVGRGGPHAGTAEQPGRSTIDITTQFIGERRTPVVLDNCEHLLEMSPELVLPCLVSGRVGAVGDDAVELFTDRAAMFGLTSA